MRQYVNNNNEDEDNKYDFDNNLIPILLLLILIYNQSNNPSIYKMKNAQEWIHLLGKYYQ